MEIEVDQSFKVERTNRPTAIAFTNDAIRSILIPAKVKQHAIARLRTLGKKGHRATLFLFAALTFLLIQDELPRLTRLWIDLEYTGHDNDIRAVLLNLIRAVMPDFPADRIAFRQVGKKSQAHTRALAVHRGGVEPDRIITLEDILKLARH